MNILSRITAISAICLGLASLAQAKTSPAGKHAELKEQNIEGWTIRVDTQLLAPERKEKTERILAKLKMRLSEIKVVMPEPHLSGMQQVPIVLELAHSELSAMQYHPGADWLKKKGYDETLVHCVHVPVAEVMLKHRYIVDMPWVILHELSHAYHHQVIGFDEPRIIAAYKKFVASGHGKNCLVITGKRTDHYALTNHKEFFAEMTEAYFGTNDFYPFNRAELMDAEPEIYQLMKTIWAAKPTKS
ncbi:hypothetical protein JIN77_16015 [Verrucomicrobiaceae bacterium R5-34]|nr:hypothetical protein [Verrucomicrobiaceae bacterium R5-34]